MATGNSSSNYYTHLKAGDCGHRYGNFRRGAFLPLPAYDAHGRRILLERCANGLPLDLIDANCQVVPWSFTQMLYSDKQTQARYLNWLQSGAAGWGKGFVKCFLRVSHAAGLNCSCHAAHASKGNFQKTCYNTLSSTCRPRQKFD